MATVSVFQYARILSPLSRQLVLADVRAWSPTTLTPYAVTTGSVEAARVEAMRGIGGRVAAVTRETRDNRRRGRRREVTRE